MTSTVINPHGKRVNFDVSNEDWELAKENPTY